MMARHFIIRRFARVLLLTMILLCISNGHAAATDSFQPIVPEGERITDIESLLGNISRGAPVRSVAFSPDGATLATGSQDCIVWIWDTASGKELKRLIGHTKSVESVAFSPDGATIASGSRDGTVRLWDISSGKELKCLVGLTSSVSSVAFSPDGKTLASGSADNTVRLWDTASGKELKRLEGHTNDVSSVAFSPDGATLASGSQDNTVRLWDAASGKELKRLVGHTASVSSVAFSPDGATLASGSQDNSVRLWDMSSGKELKSLKAHISPISSVAFSPDGATIASGSRDGTVRLWNISSGKELKCLVGLTSSVSSVVFSPDVKTLASGSQDNTVRLWDISSGKELKSLESHTASVYSVAFSPDGAILASASLDKSVRLWDISSGKQLKNLVGHTASVSSVAFSPDGKTLASGSGISFALVSGIFVPGSGDKSVRLWDISSGKELKRLVGHTASVSSVAFSPDGETLASGSGTSIASLFDFPNPGSDDNTVRLWDTASDKQKGIFIGGQRGTWLTCLFNGSFPGPHSEKKGICRRYDDGTLLVKKGEDGTISPVLPPKPEEEPNLEVVSIPEDLETYDGSATDFTIAIKNSGKASLYWVNVIQQVTGKKPVLHPSGTNVIQDLNQGKSPVFHPPATKGVLAPGETVDMACKVSVLSDYENPRGRDTLLSLKITSAFTEPVSMKIPVKVHIPRLELIEAKLQEEDLLTTFKKRVIRPLLKIINKETQKEEPSTLLVSLKNTGEQDLLSETEFRAKIANQPLDMVTRGQIKSNETITLPFVVPQELQIDPNTPPVAFKIDKDTPLQLYAAKTEHPVHVWRFPGQRITLPSPPWFMYLLFIFLFAGSLIGVYYLRLYRHPLVVRLSASPESLSRLSIDQLSQAKRLLQRTQRLDTVLSSNDIARGQLNEAIGFYENPDSRARCEMLVKLLGAEVQKGEFWPEGDAGQLFPQVYRVRMGKDFMLNMDQCLLVFPPEGMMASRILATLKQKEEDQYQVCIIITTEKRQQAELHRMSQNTANMLVTPDIQELTGLLLSPSPAETLAGLIATQVKVTRISPYQTKGGVNKENIFFGRFQLLAHIMQREPSNYLVVGGRQLGKSSLLKAVERRYRDDPNVTCHYIVLNSEEIRGHLATALDFAPDTDLPVLLKEMGQIKKGKRYIFLIDEVDKFIEAEAKTGYKTLHLFRGLSEEGRCNFILAGFWGLYHAATFDYHSPVKNFAETLFIGALEHEACFELATKPMHLLNIRYESEGLVETIIQKTGGRANLIAITCNEMLQQLDMQKRVILKNDMERAVNSHAIRSALSGWEVLSSDEKANRLDRIIVYATIGKEAFTLAELIRILDEHGCAYEAEHVKQSLARLELAFILSRAKQHYTFCVPIFKKIVLEQEPELLLEKESSDL